MSHGYVNIKIYYRTISERDLMEKQHIKYPLTSVKCLASEYTLKNQNLRKMCNVYIFFHDSLSYIHFFKINLPPIVSDSVGCKGL